MNKISTPSFFSAVICTGLLILSFPVSAQITITESRVTSEIGQRIKEVLYETNLDIGGSLQSLILAAGPDQTWDFSNLNFIDSTVTFQELTEVAINDPYINDPNLAGADLLWHYIIPPIPDGVQEDTIQQYLYGNLVNGAWTVNGAVTMADIDLDGQVDTFLQWFSPPSLQVRFPVMENSEWHDSTTFNQVFMGMPFQSAVELDSNWVSGWGSLQTPMGTADALRVNNKVVNRAFGNPFADIGNSIDFETADGAISASIVIEDGRAFHRVATNVGTTTSRVQTPVLNFRVSPHYPNPVIERTTFPLELQKSGQVKVEIYDIHGRLHNAQQYGLRAPGVQNIDWVNPGLVAGTYWARIWVGRQVQQQLLIIQ